VQKKQQRDSLFVDHRKPCECAEDYARYALRNNCYTKRIPPN